MLHTPNTVGLWGGPLFDTHSARSCRKFSLACWRLSATSAENASNLLPAVIIAFNSTLTQKTHCSLTGGRVHVFDQTQCDYHFYLGCWSESGRFRGCINLRWPLQQSRKGEQRRKNSSAAWKDISNLLDSRRLTEPFFFSTPPCALSRLMGKYN